jgi:hypothetical protein
MIPEGLEAFSLIFAKRESVTGVKELPEPQGRHFSKISVFARLRAGKKQ